MVDNFFDDSNRVSDESTFFDLLNKFCILYLKQGMDETYGYRVEIVSQILVAGES